MEEKLFNKFFEILNNMAGEGTIQWKLHFDTSIGRDGNYILRLNYKALTEKLLTCFYDNYICADKNCSGEASTGDQEAFKAAVISMGINSDSIRQELKLKSYCINCSYPVTFYSGEAAGRKLIYRAALLDVYQLQAAGVNIDNLLTDNRKDR